MDFKARLLSHVGHKGEPVMDGYVDVYDVVERYPDVSYYMLFGSRSNGKTFGALDFALCQYLQDGSEIAYIRRWDIDIQGKRGQQVFANIVREGLVKKYSKGKWDGIRYYSGQWWLTKTNKDGSFKQDSKPFAYAFSLNSMEHDKSTGYPNVRNIIFDEFLTRGFGIVDEFVIWTNVLSTIIRDPSRTDVRVFMLANTVNFDSPYFREYGIVNVKKMKVGDVDLYTYGDSAMKTLVCYTLPRKLEVTANRFTAFNNPQIQMINDGAWELAMYKHCPHQFRDNNVVFSFFIQYGEEIVQGDVVSLDDGSFIMMHPKTTPIKHPESDLIYTPNANHQRNIRANLTRPTDRIDHRIWKFFQDDKVFYSDNMTGEVVNNYIKSCQA